MSSALSPLRLAAITALVALVLAGPLRAHASESLSKTPNNISVLPLIIDGRKIPSLEGQSLLGLTAFRCAAGKTTPVVFQVDEINSQNRVVSGDALPEVSADEQPGLIDDNDQIVFMQRDLGERCGDEQLGRARGKLVEIETNGGSFRDKAYLYLLSAERGHVPSSSAVRFDKSKQMISTPAYEMTYSIEHPHMISTFVLHELRGRENKNVLDRMKVRMVAKALGALVQLNMTEEEIGSTLLSARAGPVRVVRELKLDVQPVPGLKIPAKVRFLNYERLFQAEVEFQIPKAAALFVSSLDLFLAMDYLDARGVRISTSGLPQGAVVDGRTAAMEKQFDLGDKRWFLLTGEGINHVAVLHMEEGLNLRPTARFSDGEGEDFAWPPERVPGGLPQIGYGLLGWQDLEARWYAFAIDIGMLPSFPEGGGDGFSNTITRKPGVRVMPRGDDAAGESN